MLKKKRLPGTVRRELILQAALEVFSGKGYDGSTVKKIAERAGVNEGLLYRHFKSKEDLYTAVIAMRAASILDYDDLTAVVNGKYDDQDFLKRFAKSYLQVMRSNEKLVRLISFGQLSSPELANLGLFKMRYNKKEDSPVAILTGYIKARMEDGTFVNKKPQLVARIFVGSIHWYGLRSLIAKSKNWKVYEETEVLDTLVSVFHQGLLVRTMCESRGEVKTAVRKGVRKKKNGER